MIGHFPCGLCQKVFKNEVALATHAKKEHEEDQECYECCGYSPPPILRVGGGVTPLLIYDAHSGRGFGRGQNMAATNLKPKGKKTL